MVVKRGEKYHITFRKDKKVLSVATNTTLRREAERIEQMVKHFVRTGDLTYMDYESRMVAVRLYRNQGWELPDGLINPPGEEPLVVTPVQEELTLWKATELCLHYPDVRNSANRERHKQAFIHLVLKWGKDYPVKSLWIPQIKEYQMERLAAGAKPSTINKEKAALSKMFQVLIELKHVEVNPVRLVPYLSENSDKRQVYISHKDFQRIVAAMPEWFRPIVQVAYYTGMRRGEILGMTRRKLRLKSRMIYLTPDKVKEKDWKRVPIHKDLVPVFEEVLQSNVVSLDHLFLHNGKPVVHKNQVRWPWDEGLDQLSQESEKSDERPEKSNDLNPRPHFHDLRHTWKTNARRSGMDSEIREAILGHATRAKSVSEGYGWISDKEFVQEIDKMTFDHGETVIWTSEAK